MSRKAYLILGIILITIGLILIINSMQSITGLTIVESVSTTNSKASGIYFLFAGLFSLILSKKIKRGQVAIEFLMTYGWAILAAVIVLGVLSMFGAFNPVLFSPSAATINPPFYLVAWSATEKEIALDIRNAGSESNLITNIEIDFNGGTCSTQPNYNMASGNNQAFSILCPLLKSKKSIKGDILVEYVKSSSNLAQTTKGTIEDRVAAIPEVIFYSLSLTTTGSGSGTIKCKGISPCPEFYPDGSEVTVQAIPNPGNYFNIWTAGICVGLQDPECTFAMDYHHDLEAEFTLT